jgi:hypothetical protein
VIDWSKPLWTRNGRPAQHIVELKEEGAHHLHRHLVCVVYSGGHETHYTYNDDGTHSGLARHLDLLNA